MDLEKLISEYLNNEDIQERVETNRKTLVVSIALLILEDFRENDVVLKFQLCEERKDYKIAGSKLFQQKLASIRRIFHGQIPEDSAISADGRRCRFNRFLSNLILTLAGILICDLLHSKSQLENGETLSNKLFETLNSRPELKFSSKLFSSTQAEGFNPVGFKQFRSIFIERVNEKYVFVKGSMNWFNCAVTGVPRLVQSLSQLERTRQSDLEISSNGDDVFSGGGRGGINSDAQHSAAEHMATLGSRNSGSGVGSVGVILPSRNANSLALGGISDDQRTAQQIDTGSVCAVGQTVAPNINDSEMLGDSSTGGSTGLLSPLQLIESLTPKLEELVRVMNDINRECDAMDADSSAHDPQHSFIKMRQAMSDLLMQAKEAFRSVKKNTKKVNLLRKQGAHVESARPLSQGISLSQRNKDSTNLNSAEEKVHTKIGNIQSTLSSARDNWMSVPSDVISAKRSASMEKVSEAAKLLSSTTMQLKSIIVDTTNSSEEAGVDTTSGGSSSSSSDGSATSDAVCVNATADNNNTTSVDAAAAAITVEPIADTVTTDTADHVHDDQSDGSSDDGSSDDDDEAEADDAGSAPAVASEQRAFGAELTSLIWDAYSYTATKMLNAELAAENPADVANIAKSLEKQKTHFADISLKFQGIKKKLSELLKKRATSKRELDKIKKLSEKAKVLTDPGNVQNAVSALMLMLDVETIRKEDSEAWAKCNYPKQHYKPPVQSNETGSKSKRECYAYVLYSYHWGMIKIGITTLDMATVHSRYKYHCGSRCMIVFFKLPKGMNEYRFIYEACWKYLLYSQLSFPESNRAEYMNMFQEHRNENSYNFVEVVLHVVGILTSKPIVALAAFMGQLRTKQDVDSYIENLKSKNPSPPASFQIATTADAGNAPPREIKIRTKKAGNDTPQRASSGTSSSGGNSSISALNAEQQSSKRSKGGKVQGGQGNSFDQIGSKRKRLA